VTGRHSNQLNYRSVPFGDGKDKGLGWNSEIMESKKSGNSDSGMPGFQISRLPGF